MTSTQEEIVRIQRWLAQLEECAREMEEARDALMVATDRHVRGLARVALTQAALSAFERELARRGT